MIDFLRARKPTVPIEEMAESLPAGANDPLVDLIRDERARAVQSLLRELPGDIREMFALRFGQGLRYREIADCLGLSEDAVKQRFSRTLREIRARVGDRRTKDGEVDYAF